MHVPAEQAIAVELIDHVIAQRRLAPGAALFQQTLHLVQRDETGRIGGGDDQHLISHHQGLRQVGRTTRWRVENHHVVFAQVHARQLASQPVTIVFQIALQRTALVFGHRAVGQQ
ncbi:hypothetical protein D9M73_276330 [compost metagenome]